MVSKRWKHSNTTIHNIGYHIIWCTKYRRNILVGDVEKDLKKLINEKIREIDTTIIEMEIMPDHVHLFVKTIPTASPHWIVQQIKGYTSRTLRRKYKPLRTKIPTLWTRSYYIESVGHVSWDNIKTYIENQKGV